MVLYDQHARVCVTTVVSEDVPDLKGNRVLVALLDDRHIRIITATVIQESLDAEFRFGTVNGLKGSRFFLMIDINFF
jgi:hypothetical protein